MNELFWQGFHYSTSEPHTPPQRQGSTYTVQGQVIRETDKALLFQMGDAELWFPKSQVLGVSSGDAGCATLHITEWIAREKGLI